MQLINELIRVYSDWALVRRGRMLVRRGTSAYRGTLACLAAGGGFFFWVLMKIHGEKSPMNFKIERRLGIISTF